MNGEDPERQAPEDFVDKLDRRALIAGIVHLEHSNARAIVDGGRAGFAPVLAVIRSSGALDYAREAARREAEVAARSLEGLPASRFRDSLLELASFSVTRRS